MRPDGIELLLLASDYTSIDVAKCEDCLESCNPATVNSIVMRRSHIACHAAALSWILQRPLKLDPTTESIVDDEEANQLKTRPQRVDWA